MTKTNLILKIFKIYPYMSYSNISRIIFIVLNEIVTALQNGDRVELRGFGTFGVRERDLEKKRNPKTGEAVIVEARKIPFFRAGRQLKALLNDPTKDPTPDDEGETSEDNITLISDIENKDVE